MSPPRQANDMHQQDHEQGDSQVDPMVSDRIKETADEATPKNLDDAVMREATRALRADNRRGSFGAWFRPVAFMATVGLCLAIILDLTDTNLLAPGPEPIIESLPSTTLNELKRREKSPQAEPRGGDAFVSESRKAAERVQALEATTDASSQGLPAECSEALQSAADTWWQCIESLRDAGQIEAAERELEKLRSEFPAFVPPE